MCMVMLVNCDGCIVLSNYKCCMNIKKKTKKSVCGVHWICVCTIVVCNMVVCGVCVRVGREISWSLVKLVCVVCGVKYCVLMVYSNSLYVGVCCCHGLCVCVNVVCII